MTDGTNSPRFPGRGGAILLAAGCLFPVFFARAATQPTPLPDRARIHREILDLNLRAARDPAAAASVRDRLARLYLTAGAPEKAIRIYRYSIIFDRPQAAAYYRRIAGIYRGLGRLEEAEEELRLARAAAPEDAAARRRRQLAVWEEEGRDDLLLQQYRFLYWTQSRSREQHLANIARLLVRRGEEEEAARYYRMLIAGYRRRIGEKPAAAVDYHLRIADLYREMNDGESAEEEYRRAVENEGDAGGRALAAQADFYRGRGEPQRALALYREALTRPGVDPAALRIRISALLERGGEEAAARAELEAAAEEEDGDAGRLRLRLARFLARRGEIAAALAAYHSALPALSVKERVRAWERIGDLLVRGDREEEAAAAYREALDLHEAERGEESFSALFLEKAAELAEKSRQRERADDYFRQLAEVYRHGLQSDPSRAAYYHRKLGDLLQGMGQFHPAASHYRVWSGLAPEDPAPHYRLYRLYRDHLENPPAAENHRQRFRALRAEKQPPPES